MLAFDALIFGNFSDFVGACEKTMTALDILIQKVLLMFFKRKFASLRL